VLVPPYQPFQLTWSCYTGSDTHLSWQFTGDTSVIAESVMVTGGAGTVNSGDSVPVTGRAVATINGPATFQLEVLAGRPAPANVQVGIAPLEFTGLTPSGPVLTDTGEQTVTLNWYAANVVVYTLDLNGITLTNPPAYGDRTCTVSVPPVTVPMPQSTFTYTLTAYGYGSNNEWVSIPQSVHVTPLTVALLPLGMSGPQWVPNPTGTPPEVQMVSLTFAAQNANSITITGPAPGQSVTLLPDATASPPLYLPAPTLPGPLLYGVTVTANGYFAPGVTYSAWRTFSPLTVQLGPLTASPRPSPSSGSPVSLTWTAANETGFIFDDSSSGTLTGLPAGQRQLTVNPRGETTYTLTAQGYPSGPALPYRAVTVTIKPLKEHKEVLDKLSPTTAEKHLRPKEDNPTIPAAGLPADDESELPEPDPAGPAGSQPGQQPFIGQDERPDAAPPARA